jgi:predicted N-acetyltransferase YhbS
MSELIRISRERPTATELAGLYADVGWVSLADSESLDLAASIENTSMWVVARENGDVVGIARILTDYVRYGCIYDMIVRRDKRGQGIGRRLMEEILAFCEDAHIQIVHLWPTKGNATFYEEFGFEALGPDHPVMVRRRPRPASPG